MQSLADLRPLLAGHTTTITQHARDGVLEAEDQPHQHQSAGRHAPLDVKDHRHIARGSHHVDAGAREGVGHDALEVVDVVDLTRHQVAGFLVAVVALRKLLQSHVELQAQVAQDFGVEEDPGVADAQVEQNIDHRHPDEDSPPHENVLTIGALHRVVDDSPDDEWRDQRQRRGNEQQHEHHPYVAHVRAYPGPEPPDQRPGPGAGTFAVVRCLGSLGIARHEITLLALDPAFQQVNPVSVR